MVKPSEEPSLKPHVGKETWVGVGVAEWIDVPADSWLDTELFEKELVALHHVVDHVLEVWACFVVHAPATVHEFETTFLDETPDLVFDLLSLLEIPHGEELHFDVGEFSVWTFDQFLDDCAQNEVDLGLLVLLIGARVVLIDCLEPSDVVVRVSNQVHIEMLVLVSSIREVRLCMVLLKLTDEVLTSPVRIASHCLEQCGNNYC